MIALRQTTCCHTANLDFTNIRMFEQLNEDDRIELAEGRQ